MTLSMSLPAPFRRPGGRQRRAAAVVALCALALAAASAAAIAIGPSSIPLRHLLGALAGDPAALDARDGLILHEIRLPRLLLGTLVGAALGVSGAMMQGLFRNPLADPALIGVTAGASLAAVSAIVLGGGLLAPLAALAGIHFLPAMAFAGALATTSLLYAISTTGGRTGVATLLLAGIAIGAAVNAVTGLLIFLADDAELRDITFWSLGSLGGATWGRLFAVFPFLLAVVVAIPFTARGLDALALGEAEAGHLGVSVERLKRVVVVAVAAACGGAVAVAGSIGFVGIVVPHLLRLAMGPSNRWLLPASAIFGAALLVAADTVCRIVVAPAELPIGIVTAMIGAPVFITLILRRRASLGL